MKVQVITIDKNDGLPYTVEPPAFGEDSIVRAAVAGAVYEYTKAGYPVLSSIGLTSAIVVEEPNG